MSRRNRPRTRDKSRAIGAEIIEGVTELPDALQAGVSLEQRFKVRTVEVADLEQFDARRVRALRHRLAVSQNLFAKLLGVSTILVQSWEQGVRTPSPLARRLLAEMEHDPRRWQRMIVTQSSPRARRKSA